MAKRRASLRAKIALARKLAIALHRMWGDGTDLRFGKEAAVASEPTRYRPGRPAPQPPEVPATGRGIG